MGSIPISSTTSDQDLCPRTASGDSQLTPGLTPGRPRAATVSAMKGTARKRGAGRWQIQVYGGVDPHTGRERRVTRTVLAPHTRAGQKVVDQAITALILDVENGRIGAGDDPTVAELLDRWVHARETDWSPKTTLENR
ncbi:MAG: hypothetical protein ACXWA3_14110, partial [Acidimicrobiales bacterium]